MKFVKFAVILAVALFSLTFQSPAQKNKSCALPEYNNCVGLEQIKLSKISGQVSEFLENKEGGKETIYLSDACVTLYSNDKKVIDSTETDEKGRFKLKNVPDGNYWLVVSDDYKVYTPALIEIKVDRKLKEKRKMTVRMVISGIDTCSYGELQ